MKLKHLPLALLLSATPVLAQFIPDRPASGVDDSAELISDTDEAAIADRIATLEEEKGVELAVLTLSSVAFYGLDQSQEDFATDLFNAWGLGDAEDNDGILLLVFRDDRTMRIELGEGYDAADETAAAEIVSDVLVPAFAEGDTSRGAREGVEAIISRIAAPAPAASATGGEAEGTGFSLWWLLAIIGVPVAGIAALVKRNNAKLAAEPCAACGKPGLERSSRTIVEATETSTGEGEKRKLCPSCGHEEIERYTIPKKTAARTGGSSDGKGASGKW